MFNNNLPLVTGDNIRRLRVLKGLKQLDAGKKLGIGQQAYSKIECSPEISQSKARRILNAFESNEEELGFIIKSNPTPKKMNLTDNNGLFFCL